MLTKACLLGCGHGSGNDSLIVWTVSISQSVSAVRFVCALLWGPYAEQVGCSAVAIYAAVALCVEVAVGHSRCHACR